MFTTTTGVTFVLLMALPTNWCKVMSDAFNTAAGPLTVTPERPTGTSVMYPANLIVDCRFSSRCKVTTGGD
jgi:hypothetical protein